MPFIELAERYGENMKYSGKGKSRGNRKYKGNRKYWGNSVVPNVLNYILIFSICNSKATHKAKPPIMYTSEAS